MVKNKLCAIVNLTENEDALKPLTHMRPIGALPFASRYRLVDFMLSSVSHAEIDSCALFISESGRSIYDHVRSGESWNFDSRIAGGIFTFSQQNWKIRHVEENGNSDFYDNHRIFMERSHAEYVFVSGSKMIANVDIRAIQRHHINSQSDITLVYKSVLIQNEEDYSLNTHIELDQYGQIEGMTQVYEVPIGNKANVNLNMYVLSVEKVLEILQRAQEEACYMELDALIQRYLLDYTVNVYEYTGYAASIDSIKQYYRANMEMLDRSKFSALFTTSQPVLTKSKNGVPTYYAPNSTVSDSLIATSVRIDGEVTHSIINRKVRVHKDAKVTNSIVMQGTEIREGAVVEYAIIDKNCIIEPHTQIIGSPDNIIVVKRQTVLGG